MSRRVAVIGAGLTGLVAGYELALAGIEPTVYERWPGLGGQAATFDVGDMLIERYYHHLFTSDRDIADLYDELGMPDAIEWLPSSVAVFVDGSSRPFTTPMDLLRFSPLSLPSRLRLGLGLAMLHRRRVEQVESETAHEWVVRSLGKEAWDKLIGPLLRGKFGDRAEDVSMAWLWARFTVRRQVRGRQARGEVLGYPHGSFEHLFGALRGAIEERGGRVLIDQPVAVVERHHRGFAVTRGARQSFRRGHDPREFEPVGEPELYSGAVATVANPIFEQMLGPRLTEEVGASYLGKLQSVDYHAALCLVLELDRRFSPFYWTNIADAQLPFLGLIEQANLVGSQPYGGRHFLYVANYVPQDDPLLKLSADELLAHYEPGLRRVNEAYERSWLRSSWLFREPDAQPIITPGYRERMASLDTGAGSLVLANTSQIYPEDRGTNYAVRLGREAARRLQRSLN